MKKLIEVEVPKMLAQHLTDIKVTILSWPLQCCIIDEPCAGVADAPAQTCNYQPTSRALLGDHGCAHCGRSPEQHGAPWQRSEESYQQQITQQFAIARTLQGA